MRGNEAKRNGKPHRRRSEAETGWLAGGVTAMTEGNGNAEEADEAAQQAEVRGCASTVNAAVVQWKGVFLSREACGTCVPATESGDGSDAAVTPADTSSAK